MTAQRRAMFGGPRAAREKLQALVAGVIELSQANPIAARVLVRAALALLIKNRHVESYRAVREEFAAADKQLNEKIKRVSRSKRRKR